MSRTFALCAVAVFAACPPSGPGDVDDGLALGELCDGEDAQCASGNCGQDEFEDEVCVPDECAAGCADGLVCRDSSVGSGDCGKTCIEPTPAGGVCIGTAGPFCNSYTPCADGLACVEVASEGEARCMGSGTVENGDPCGEDMHCESGNCADLGGYVGECAPS